MRKKKREREGENIIGVLYLCKEYVSSGGGVSLCSSIKGINLCIRLVVSWV